MILYLDTSSIVKLYVEEDHSRSVREWLEDAEVVATCRVAFPEAFSAMNRRFRAGDFSKEDYELLIEGVSGEWANYAVIDFDEIEAGRLVEKYGLRGFDAVHLSAANTIKRVEKDIHITFSSFDKKLNEAAAAEGFTVLTL